AGLAYRVRWLPPGAYGPRSMRQSRTASTQGQSGQQQKAQGHGHIAPGAVTSPQSLAPCATVTVRYKTATGQTGLGKALASRLPADTIHMPGCRPARPQELPALW